MSNSFDVLIIGGGIVGLTAALGMAQHHEVAVLDSGSLSTDLSKPDARVYAVNKASQKLFQQLKVWSHLDIERLSPYKQMFVWDAANGANIHFDSRTIANKELGFIVEESVLKQALLDRIAHEPNIKLLPKHWVDKVEPCANGVLIHCQSEVFKAKLLMAADGAQSPTRQKLGVKLTSWPYHQDALVATVTTEKPHQQIAYQVFNPDGPLAFLPLSDPYQCSIVWSTDSDKAQAILKLEKEQLNHALRTAFAEKLGQVKVMQGPYHFPLHMRHAHQYSGKNWLLLGDAAHTIHPLAGLGLNVGLADIATWLSLMDTEKKLYSQKMLGAYQRERKHAIWQTILLMEGFKRLFGNTSAPVVALRGLGLKMCNDVGLLKRLFIQHASG